MSAIGHHGVLGFRPCLMNPVSGLHGAYNIVTSLDNDGRDFSDDVDPVQQRIRRFYDFVPEIVCFDAGESEGMLFLVLGGDCFIVREESLQRGRVLPCRRECSGDSLPRSHDPQAPL